MRGKGMGSVTEEDEFVGEKGGRGAMSRSCQTLRVEGSTLRIREWRRGEEGREGCVDFQDLGNCGAFVPFWVLSEGVEGSGMDGLTVAGGGVGFGVRVDTDKVEELIVIAGVNYNSAVIAVPHEEGVYLFNQRGCEEICVGYFAGDEKSEGCFSGAEEWRVFDILSRH